MNPLVTIAIPTYNRANSFLKECITSALNQSYSNIEILVSDNYSNDLTPDIINSFSDSRLTYFRQNQNIGQNRNMNFLLAKAKGDYFLMYHDDDQIDKDFIETCVSQADFRKDAGLILTGARVIDKDGTVVRERQNNANGLSTEDFIMLWYKTEISLFLCCSLFGTKVLRDTGGFNPKYGHFDDVAAEMNCAALGGRVDVREVKASFREHPESGTSSSRIADWCDSSLALLDLACSLAPSHKRELQKLGLRTSAERNYRYASEISFKREQIRAYWIVYKKFNFRQLPQGKYLYTLVPPLRYILKPSSIIAGLKRRFQHNKPSY
jgi:glycosyltransferase involved in cell wall biosynthesis